MIVMNVASTTIPSLLATLLIIILLLYDRDFS